MTQFNLLLFTRSSYFFKIFFFLLHYLSHVIFLYNSNILNGIFPNGHLT